MIKVTFLDLLTLVLLVLKATGYIDCAWWVVGLPVVVGGIFSVLIAMQHSKKGTRRRK